MSKSKQKTNDLTDLPEGKPLSAKKLQQIQDQEQKTDQEVASRTARFDQDLRERARKYSINPDNFDNEQTLGEAVKAYEEANNIKGLPHEGDEDNASPTV